MIALRLHKRFKNTTVPFCLDVEYEIGGRDKTVVLFGPSGSGKSLTMQCLAGLMRPDARVYPAGRPNPCTTARQRSLFRPDGGASATCSRITRCSRI